MLTWIRKLLKAKGGVIGRNAIEPCIGCQQAMFRIARGAWVTDCHVCKCHWVRKESAEMSKGYTKTPNDLSRPLESGELYFPTPLDVSFQPICDLRDFYDSALALLSYQQVSSIMFHATERTKRRRTMPHMEIIDMSTDEGRARLDEYDQEKAEQVRTGQQIYAKIKRSSKYFGQTKPGERFPVFVESGAAGSYLVQGGPGGQYRLADVQLFVVDRGAEVRISG